MMAVNSSIPNIPRLLVVKVDPSNSAGCSLRSLARPASSLVSPGNLSKSLLIGILNYRCYQAFIDRYRNGYMHFLMKA